MEDRELSRINDLLREAYSAGSYAKAARIARQGAELATERDDQYWRVSFRFMEGNSLAMVGDKEAATIALMEAARPDAEADQADIYVAISELTEIAVVVRSKSFVRQVIAQGRDHLERCGRVTWRHMLDLQEGNLALQCGDWSEAQRYYRSAYEAKRKHWGYPGYTTGRHLIALVATSFRLHDVEALAYWRRTLDDCRKEIEHDHLYAEDARMLCHRAGLPGLGDPLTSARSMLLRVEGYEGDKAEFIMNSLRVLILQHHWPLVDGCLPFRGIDSHWLFGGDVHLARAREALALPPRDEDWCTDFERPDPAALTEAQRTQAREHLAAARIHYESKLDWAAKEDQRLETDYYTRILKARLKRAADLVS